MNANANIVKQVEGKSTLVRPRFSTGLLLRDDDLTVGVDYTRELSRLLFQSLFGCGVVCGLRVSVTLECGKLLVTVPWLDGLVISWFVCASTVASNVTVTVRLAGSVPSATGPTANAS